MPIHFKCPECGKSIEAPDGSYGKAADCPACGKPVTVPEPPKLRAVPPRRETGSVSGYSVVAIFLWIGAAVALPYSALVGSSLVTGLLFVIAGGVFKICYILRTPRG